VLASIAAPRRSWPVRHGVGVTTRARDRRERQAPSTRSPDRWRGADHDRPGSRSRSPAVLGYNAFVRSTASPGEARFVRHDVYAVLTTGSHVRQWPRSRPPSGASSATLANELNHGLRSFGKAAASRRWANHMVPLIDVMLVLLVIFMYRRCSRTRSGRPPQGIEPAQHHAPDHVAVRHRFRRHVYWNGEALTLGLALAHGRSASSSRSPKCISAPTAQWRTGGRRDLADAARADSRIGFVSVPESERP